MTSAEWLANNNDPQWLMLKLQGTRVTRTKAGRRKLRLFGCECCRRFWDHLWDDQLRRAVEVAESFAEGQATKHDLARVHATVTPLTGDDYHAAKGHGPRERTAASMIHWLTVPPAFGVAFTITSYELPLAGYCGEAREENRIICSLQRDIFGNSFRSLAFAPNWQTSTAVAIAQQMYESRDFSAMPILADALQDAGCDCEDILTHCRDENQVHVRGCWVVDLVLDKS